MSNGLSSLYKSEDWWAVWFGVVIFALTLGGLISRIPKIGSWTDNPLNAFASFADTGEVSGSIVLSLLGLMLGLGILTTIGISFMKAAHPGRYFAGFVGVFVLACVAYWIAHQTNIKYWGLSYALWALLVGLLISNTVGTPKWLRAGAQTELFIKTGLVLMGAEVLFRKIISLGPPGLMVAWIVTPVVVVFMFQYGKRYLKMTNLHLVIIIAAATSVCGVSAAIATAAACCAKKEDLTLAVGMTLIFTVLMMFFMPLAISGLGMDPILGAAWMGGTIDSTGAVVAAGSMLGPDAEKVAAVVKMIQNVLIGVLAFAVALYWVTVVDRQQRRKEDPSCAAPSAIEIWHRFPKFVLGFVGASLFFSFVLVPEASGGYEAVEADYIKPVTKVLRGWFFCMAFAAIGLESNFRDLASRMERGKPMILYAFGQSFNLILTLLVAYLAFMVFFPGAI
ncbi:putative sulfate exporter family transporter [candidate division GN15 bacterium]|nr:putative sulfate exporter family transporter [candidate division GN15 bacterium]